MPLFHLQMEGGKGMTYTATVAQKQILVHFPHAASAIGTSEAGRVPGALGVVDLRHLLLNHLNLFLFEGAAHRLVRV